MWKRHPCRWPLTAVELSGRDAASTFTGSGGGVEAVVEGDGAARDGFAERQGEKVLRRNFFQKQFRKMFEAEVFVVGRFTDEQAAVGSRRFEPGESFADESLPDSLSLKFRQNGDGAESVPAGTSIRNCYGREGNMADDFSIDFRNQRNRQCVRFSQSMDDKALSLFAVRMVPEGRFGDGRYSVDVGSSFWSDEDVHETGM